MLEISDKLNKHLSLGTRDIAAIAGIVVSSLSDPQSSVADWESGEMLDPAISTELTSDITSVSDSAPVTSTDDFTAAGAVHPAYLLFTDGSNSEIAAYANADPSGFTQLTRGQYGTTARDWPSGTPVYQLTFSHGNSPDYDLQPQRRGWWAHLDVSGGPPSQRVGHAWIYRKTDGCFYMFGGYDGTNYLNDLWKFDPSNHTWTQLSPSGSPPSPRAYMCAVYASDLDQMWLTSGADDTIFLNDTFKYDFAGGAWSTDSDWDLGDIGRKASMCCYDTERGEMLVAGGLTSFEHEHFVSETYAFDGYSWNQKSSTPYVVAYGAGCWLSAEKRFFMVAATTGNNYAALAYDPAADAWEDDQVPDPPIPVRWYPGCCYDDVSGVALVFAGETVSGGAGTRTLLSFHYPSGKWAELPLFYFNGGADTYTRHGFAWDSANACAAAWGGRNDDAPTWHTHPEPVFYRHYHRNAEYRTGVIDVGEAPDRDGVWNLEDVTDFVGGSNSVAYSAEYSDDASTWHDAGAVTDGAAITQRSRYWRITVNFTTDGGAPPRVQKIDPVFDEVIEFAMAPHSVSGRLPLVKSISNLASAIDPVKCTARIGSVKVELLDSDKVLTDIVRSSYLSGKTLYVKLGAIADDVKVEDFVTVFTGAIEEWRYDGLVLSIEAGDFLGKLEKDIPEEDSEGNISPLQYNDAGIASHPVDILTDILRNRLNVPDRHLDLASFDDVKNDDSISDWAFDRTISDPTDAYDLCLEICRHIGAILIPREDGRLALKMLKAGEQPSGAWDEMTHNFRNAEFDSNCDSMRNYVSTWYHWDGSGDEWSDFEGAEVAIDAESADRRGTSILRTKSKWLGDNAAPYNGDQLAAAISSRILALAREGLPTVSLEADISTLAPQVGDVVRVRSAVVTRQDVYRNWQRRHNPTREIKSGGGRRRYSLPYLAPGCNECVDTLWWVTRKRVNIDSGVIRWELARARQMPMEKTYTTQEDFYEGSGENLDLETSPGTILLALDSGWYYESGWWEVATDMGQAPEREGEWNIDAYVPSDAAVNIYAWASETGAFAGEQMYLGSVLDGDKISARARWYKVRVELFSSSDRVWTPEIYSVGIAFPA